MNNFVKKQLLCKFSDNISYLSHIEEIKKTFDLIDNKIFVFLNEKKIKEFYLTFNVKKDNNSSVRLKNTISVHRKKETNTIYTLNAMNRLIEDENGGVFDKQFQVSWDLYKNSIILINNPGVKIIPIKLFNLIKL